MRRLAGCLVSLLSIVLSLVAGEILLREISARKLHILDVEMWRYARFVKRTSAFPGAVEEHRPNADEWLMGARVRTDERGLRKNAQEVEAKRTPNDRLVAAVGDSLTFGWGAPEPDTWPSQLEEILRESCGPSRVLNAGIGNSNTSMQLARYRAVVRSEKPAWVVLGYFINDAESDPQPATNPLLWNSSFAGLLSTRIRQTAEVRLRDYQLYYRDLYQEGRPGWDRTRAALAEFGAQLQKDGTPATLILLPELHEPKNFGEFAAAYAEVAEIARAAGWEVLDPSGRFPVGGGEKFWVTPGDAHPNRPAQRIFAETIATSRFACDSNP